MCYCKEREEAVDVKRNVPSVSKSANIFLSMRPEDDRFTRVSRTGDDVGGRTKKKNEDDTVSRFFV